MRGLDRKQDESTLGAIVTARRCVGEGGVVKGNRIGFFGDARAASPFLTLGYLTQIDSSLMIPIQPQTALGRAAVCTQTRQTALGDA